MNTCPHCGYLMPESWMTCRRCQSPVPARVPEPALSVPDGSDYGATASLAAPPAAPVWTPPAEPDVAIRTIAAPAWWQDPRPARVLTGVGFVCILAAAFALPWMEFGGFVRASLSYRDTQDFLSARDSFTRLALDLGPLILLADMLFVGWRLASTGRIGREAIAAPAGLTLLVLYVANQIQGMAVGINGTGSDGVFGIHASIGSGPWLSLFGCACLIAGGVLGPSAHT
jgi:hypothetical protein